MIRRRNLRKVSRQIRDKIFPLFPGHQDRIVQLKMQIDDEPTEHQKLVQWLKKTHNNLKQVEQYISSSDDNAYRFLPYYDPIFVKQEKIPFQQFLSQKSTLPSSKIQRDEILNEQNANHVRQTIHHLRQLLHQVIQNNTVPSHPSYPHIRRLTKRRISTKPEIKQQQKQQSTSKKRRVSVSIKPEIKQQQQKRPSKPRSTKTRSRPIKTQKTFGQVVEQIPVPYYTVNPNQQFMNQVVKSMRTLSK